MDEHWLLKVGLAVERRNVSAGITYAAASPYHRLGLHIGGPVNASCRCDSQRHHRVQSHGDIDIVPAGLDGEWEDDGDCSILRVQMTTKFLDEAAEDLDIAPARTALIPVFQHRDRRIEHIALALDTQFDINSRPDRLVVESLAKALAYQLLGSRVQQNIASTAQKLSLIQRRRITDFIENHLEQDLSLAELAHVVGISVSHLSTLFRRSFNMPVHQYVLCRRVDRARALIASGDLPLSQIALVTGFAHQSHMASVMKRFLGITPAALSRLGS